MTKEQNDDFQYFIEQMWQIDIPREINLAKSGEIYRQGAFVIPTSFVNSLRDIGNNEYLKAIANTKLAQDKAFLQELKFEAKARNHSSVDIEGSLAIIDALQKLLNDPYTPIKGDYIVYTIPQSWTEWAYKKLGY